MNAHTSVSKKENLRTSIVRWFLLGLIVFLSSSIFVFFIFNSWINTNPNAGFVEMISGTAHRPYVTRVLIPWLTRGISAALPASADVGAKYLGYRSVLVGSLITAYKTEPGYEVEAIVSLSLQWLSILGFAFSFRGLYRKVFNTPELVPELFTLVALLGITPMLFYGYLYDFSSLFLTTLGLYCIAARKKLGYFVVFTLAVLNKETAIVLILPAILLFWDWMHPSLAKVIRGILLQLGIYFAIRLPIGWIYRNNPGGMLESHWAEHAIILRDYPVVSILTFLLAAGMIWLAFNRWRDKPALLMLGAIPVIVMLPMFMICGYPFEIRVFYEVYSVGFMSMVYTLLLPRIKLPVQWLTLQDWLNSLAGMISRMTVLPQNRASRKPMN